MTTDDPFGMDDFDKATRELEEALIRDREPSPREKALRELPARWRGRAGGTASGEAAVTYRTCADELEDALGKQEEQQ